MLRFYLTMFFLFSFFLLSLFAPLNGIQQLEDISDTHLSGSFYLPFLYPTGTKILCDTALLSWRFWLGTLACFYYREFKTDNWRVVFWRGSLHAKLASARPTVIDGARPSTRPPGSPPHHSRHIPEPRRGLFMTRAPHRRPGGAISPLSLASTNKKLIPTEE